MTSEEIRSAAEALGRSVDTVLIFANGRPCPDEFLRVTEAAMRSLVSRAYEEAALALCVECRYKAPCYMERGRWRHPEGECKAHAVRALADSIREGEK